MTTHQAASPFAPPLEAVQPGSKALPLVVFSHLRWDFVYQRPQHLLSRFAAHRRVIVIEEPIHGAGPAAWERQAPSPNIR
ncbi:MAG TPA: hypothetical protein VD886_04730, partial [Herpetosiphonaceae bacterium]|nr:hypothetical protein [Herpetosiphonaceae bacterium]